MGEAKRRKQLDPKYGNQKVLKQLPKIGNNPKVEMILYTMAIKALGTDQPGVVFKKSMNDGLASVEFISLSEIENSEIKERVQQIESFSLMKVLAWSDKNGKTYCWTWDLDECKKRQANPPI